MDVRWFYSDSFERNVGATTFSKMTFFQIDNHEKSFNTDVILLNALDVILMNVIMLSVNPLNVILINVIMMNAIMLSVNLLNVIIINVIMMNAILINVIVFITILLIVIMMNVIQ